MTDAVRHAGLLADRLRGAFGEPAVDRFAHIPVIGCCAEHESGFAWYRSHHWGEIPGADRAGQIDWYEVSALHDEVYFAFVPGFCLTILDAVRRWYDRLDFSAAGIIEAADPALLAGRTDFAARVEDHLSFDQYRCVKAVLMFLNDCLSEIEGAEPHFEARGAHAPLARAIERTWDDWRLYRLKDGASPLEAGEVIARAYDVLSTYLPGKVLAACPECLPEDLNRTLRNTALRDIPSSLLNTYCEAIHVPALDDPAVIDEFRHFLPRMMELCHAGDWPTPYDEGYHLLARMYRVIAAGRSGPGQRDDEETCFLDFIRVMVDACMRRKDPSAYATDSLFDYLRCEETYGLAKSRLGRRIDSYILDHPGKYALRHIAEFCRVHLDPPNPSYVFDAHDLAWMAGAARRLQAHVDQGAGRMPDDALEAHVDALAAIERVTARGGRD